MLLQVLEPKAYADLVSQAKKSVQQGVIEVALDAVRDELPKYKVKSADISGRQKSLSGVYKKMQAKGFQSHVEVSAWSICSS